jgi:hypothetical protein
MITKISAKEIVGYFEPKKHKPSFGEGCLKLLDRGKQALYSVNEEAAIPEFSA